MARHAFPRTPTAQRALLRAGLALTTAGAALGAGAATAAADTAPVADTVRTLPASPGDLGPRSGLQALTAGVHSVTGSVEGLRPNPLAGTGADLLDNGVGTQVADFKPVSSRDLTGPVAQAESLGNVPVVGQVLGLLHG
jgi:hypothetical protein